MVIAKLHITIITVHLEVEHKAKILPGSQEQVPDKSWSSTLTFDCTKEFLWFFKSSTFTTGCDPKPRNREGPLSYWHTCSPRKASSGLSRSPSSPGLLYHPGISATFPTHLVMLHMWVKPKRNWILGRSDRALTGFRHAKPKGRASASQKPEPNEKKGAQLVWFEAKWNIWAFFTLVDPSYPCV